MGFNHSHQAVEPCVLGKTNDAVRKFGQHQWANLQTELSTQLLLGHNPHILPVQTQQSLLLLDLTASRSVKFAAHIMETL